MSFDRGAPAIWFVEIQLDGETLRHCNAFEPITFDGQVYEALGDRFTAPADIDRAANLKSQKFKLKYDSSRQTDNTDPIGKILDSNWKRRPIRVRYAVGDMDADGFDFSDPTTIVDETGRIKDLEDTLSAGDAPELEMEVESGALIFLERRNQTRSPLNQRAAFPGDAFFDLARRLDGAVLPWRTKRARQGSAQITYDVEGVAPRQMIIGRGVTRGSFVFGCTIDTHRSRWCQVYALADHQCAALEKLFINGEDVLAGEAPLVHGVERTISAASFNSGGPRLYVTWYDGRHDQTANARLISGTASQALKWTSEHRGRGVSYVVIEHAWDSDLPESFTYEFVVKGALIYQERLDTTAGGSGAHRLDDPDTWTWTENPEEALRHYLRGRVVAPGSDYKWFGVGAATAFLDPYALYAYRAAHAEASVATLGGGTQTRYTANGWLSASDSHAKNIQKLADCMVADAVDEGGRVSIRLAEPQTPVVELFDSDLVDDAQTVLTPNARADDVINRVEGQYLNPSNKYAGEDYAAIESATFEEIDGEQITGTWKQDLETSEERAQRKATLYLNKMRRTVEIEETFGLKAKDVRPGDWITRSSALRGFPSGKTFIADEVRRFVDGSVRLILLEVDPAELVWSEANAVLSPAQDPFSLESADIIVPDISVSAIAITGGSVEIPAVRFAVTTYDIAQGDEVICEYGIWNGLSGGSAAIAGASDYVKFPGNFQTFDALKGLLPGTGYAFRFRAREGERLSAWSTFRTLTTTGTYQAGSSAIADSIVGQGTGATANNLAGLNATDDSNLTTSLSTSRRLIVSDFNADGRHWTNGFGGTPEAAADPVAEGYTDVASVGRAIRFNAFPKYLTPKGVFTPVPGRRYAVLARVRTETAPTGGSISLAVQAINGLNTSFGHGDPGALQSGIPGLANAITPAVGVWTTIGRVFTLAPSPNTYNAYWRPRLDITATGSGGRAEVVSFLILDVTDVPLGRLISSLLRDDGTTAITESAVITLLGTAAAITGQGWGATASLSDAANSAVPLGANLIQDAGFRDTGTAYWRAVGATGSFVKSVAVASGIRYCQAAATGVSAGSNYRIDAPNQRGLPVVEGDKVEISCLAGGTTGLAFIARIYWYNAAGALVTATSAAYQTFSLAGGGDRSTYHFVGGIVTAPAGAVWATPAFYVTSAAGGTSQLRVAAPFMAAARADQTALTPLSIANDFQPGADPTAANTAAAITGQGALAVLNAVDTAQILSGAVTNSGVSQTAASITLTNNTWTDVASFSFTSVGIGVELRATCGIRATKSFSGGSLGDLEYRLLRGATELIPPRIAPAITYDDGFVAYKQADIVADYNDIPSSGTYTYALQCRINVTDGGVPESTSRTVINRYLSAREFKR